MATVEVLPVAENRRARLKELEGVIAHGWDHVVEMGRALREIRDDGLYLELDGGLTFEQYVRGRWALDRSSAYRKIEAADLQDVLSPIGDTPILNEAVARELAPVLRQQGEKIVVEAWTKIAERYQQRRPPTAREVNKALIEDGYRQRIIGPSSGKINQSVRLGMVGDKINATHKRLHWFVDHEFDGELVKTDQERAAGYAATLEAMAGLLRQLAAGEVPK